MKLTTHTTLATTFAIFLSFLFLAQSVSATVLAYPDYYHPTVDDYNTYQHYERRYVSSESARDSSAVRANYGGYQNYPYYPDYSRDYSPYTTRQYDFSRDAYLDYDYNQDYRYTTRADYPRRYQSTVYDPFGRGYSSQFQTNEQTYESQYERYDSYVSSRTSSYDYERRHPSYAYDAYGNYRRYPTRYTY